jgi:hypothetical protein
VTAGADREATPFYPVGEMSFGEHGPDRLLVSCLYEDFGPHAGQWMVDMTIWEHTDLVDHDCRHQWDPDRDEQLPEACFGMSITQAHELIAMLTEAVEAAELFSE